MDEGVVFDSVIVSSFHSYSIINDCLINTNENVKRVKLSDRTVNLKLKQHLNLNLKVFDLKM
ncbi:conserved hypothetical protein [Brochothrix thermosphacta]|nr:conserved hypothetical protein [Brochothrix thermosphacta]